MLYFLSKYKKELLLASIFFFLPFVLPRYGNPSDAGTLVTATSTVFAIFAGFLIADAMSNYLRLQSLIAEENSALITIADDSKQIDTEGHGKVFHAIDEYVITQLELNTLNHVSETEKHIDDLHESIHRLVFSEKDTVLYDHILSMEEKIRNTRQEIALVSKKALNPVHWSTLVILGILVFSSILLIRDGSFFLNAISGLMIFGTCAIIIVLRGMDDNTFLEYKLGYQNPREVFHAIERPPYYPSFCPMNLRKPDQDGNMRVGRK